VPSQRSLVVLVGRTTSFHLPEELSLGTVKTAPGFVDVSLDQEKAKLTIMPRKSGRGEIVLKGKDRALAFRVTAFSDKEAFLVTALSCNHHEGWNPALQNRLPHEKCCGPDKKGNAFIHVKNLARILHSCEFPITWFIDLPTAQQNLKFFTIRQDQYYDEIAFMPSSYSHFNPVNYNLEKSPEQTLKMIKNGKEELERLFQQRITTLAIDQFIGSVGTHFVQAAAELGMKALWGVGFDHVSCDTSMFHGGCPWNPYRPDKGNFRIPGKDPYPLWIFQWTFRDLINTVHTPGGASGAVMFSTDVDDILAAQIAGNQEDYYLRMANELIENKKHNDMLVLTIHQEDHDSWNQAGCSYYERFFLKLYQMEVFTPATMGEVADWLNLKFPYPGQPTQKLYLHDPLLCKDDVIFVHPDIKKPDDWPPGEETYPPHVFFYNSDYQLIFQEKSPIPFRFIDYTKSYPVPENGIYPHEELPLVEVQSLKFIKDRIIYDFHSQGDYPHYPFAIWTQKQPLINTLAIPGGFVVFLPVHKGVNKGEFILRENP